MPTCFSHFLIFCIHCSQFGNRSKWRRRRAAVVIATAKGRTTRFWGNKKSCFCCPFFFLFSFWLKTSHCFEEETCGWHCHSCILPPDRLLLNLQRKGRIIKAWWGKVVMTPLLKSIPHSITNFKAYFCIHPTQYAASLPSFSLGLHCRKLGTCLTAQLNQ